MSLQPSGDQVGGDKVGRDKVGRDVIYQTTIVSPTIVLTPAEREERRAVLYGVQLRWIAGMLEQSLWQAARLDLPLTSQPGAVQRPYQLATRGSLGDQLLPDGTRIAEVYAAQRGALLILGAPGAGKT